MARIALIGLGMVSGTYAAAIDASPDMRLARVHARSRASCDAFLAKHPDLGAQAVGDLSDLRADDVDFAILATPPDARLEAVETLCDARIPILMEKPVARNLAEARAIVERCEAASLPLGLVLQHRARPVLSDLLAILPRLGDILAIEVAVPWWRPQSYYDVPGRGTYGRDGGGVLVSQAIHTLDLMLHVAGPVRAVTAMASTTGFHQMEAEDFVTAGLSFASGAAGALFASTASFPGRGERLILHGRNGSARLEAGLVRVDWQSGESEEIGAAAQSGAGADPMAFTSDWHQSVIEDFASALIEDRPPLVPGRAGLAVHGLIDALERSARIGQKVEVET